MKLAILAGASALALSACAGVTEKTGLTATEQQCIVVEGTAYATTGVNGWGAMTYPQKAAAMAAGVDAIALTCSIDNAMLATARPVISAAIQAAALAE